MERYKPIDSTNKFVDDILDIWEKAFDFTYFNVEDHKEANLQKQKFISKHKDEIDSICKEYLASLET